MAPELWNGAPSGPATDLYAATAVLCESVTGKPPFSGRLGQLRQHHESTPVALDRFDPPLQGLVAWGMAKNPADRPRSARAFLPELDARAAPPTGRTGKSEGRRELAERAAALLPLLAAGRRRLGDGDPEGPAQAADLRRWSRPARWSRWSRWARVALSAMSGKRPASSLRPWPSSRSGHRDAAGGGVHVRHRDHVRLQRHGHRHRAGEAVLPLGVLVRQAGPGPDAELHRARAPAGQRRDRQDQQGGQGVGRDQGAQRHRAKTSNKATYRLLCGARQ